jgi:hypothetical protein
MSLISSVFLPSSLNPSLKVSSLIASFWDLLKYVLINLPWFSISSSEKDDFISSFKFEKAKLRSAFEVPFFAIA